jgi:hydrogenase maturation protein HypF
MIEEIRVYGTVQGVGFRPTVYRLAKACGLRGDVCNHGEGVLIRVAGNEVALGEFVTRLKDECPPLAKIKQLIRTPYTGEFDFADFLISPSVNSQVNTEIVPDAATCPECQREIFSPFSRFYRYPFTNCTHCGPRLSILHQIPYDRQHTTMAKFTMCSECDQEYTDVKNRRFHAQPLACHLCGPQAWLERADGKPVTSYMFSQLDDVDAICTLLQKGAIVAIKGLSGIHLACDATQEIVVQKLRERKQRDRKPLALMARDIHIINEYCQINPQEVELLTSSAAPIVLLTAKNKKRVAASVAPGQNTLGFMLPYTPLHHLILQRMNSPIVLTSANLANEPQCIDHETAREKLGKIADYFLFHNRDIVNRVDDSVVRIVEGKVQILRRARGYAPSPIHLPLGFDQTAPILAMGGELKSTFCLFGKEKAILSQHLGDLENALAFSAYQETLNLYLNLFAQKPEIIAVDQHPEYLSRKLGQEIAFANNIQLEEIQHHHAHIASCLIENQIPLNSSAVLGIAFDGSGYGEDQTLWGGEILLADYRKFQRLATFKPIHLIGGEQAIYQPWRSTYAHLISGFTWDYLADNYGDLEIFKFLDQKPRNLINQIIAKGINSPLTSSVGRLFDAVAAAIGICREVSSYEGQAAIEMEALVDVDILNNYEEILNYNFNLEFFDTIYYIDSAPMWLALLQDLQRQTSPSIIATKFHKSLVNVIIKIVKQLAPTNQVTQVVLTGGVFQNKILLAEVTHNLQKLGLEVLTHSLTPSNDGSLSLGQAAIAAARLIERNIKKCA